MTGKASQVLLSEALTSEVTSLTTQSLKLPNANFRIGEDGLGAVERRQRVQEAHRQGQGLAVGSQGRGVQKAVDQVPDEAAHDIEIRMKH